MENIAKLLKSYGTELSFEKPDPLELVERQCKAYNDTEGTATDGYDCRLCKNKGFISRPREYNGTWSEVFVPCKCHSIRQIIRKLNRSGLKDAVKKYTFQNFEVTEPWQEKLIKASLEYAEKPEGWFYIAGQSGSGKTHLCTAIAIQLIRKGASAKYMLWRDDIVKIKAAVTDYDAYSSIIDELKQTQVLYIDDLFKTGKGPDNKPQRPTGADINIAFEVLNYRYNNNLPTIISTECVMDELIEIDEAIAGRIAEKAGEHCYSIGRDRRKNYRMKNIIEL